MVRHASHALALGLLLSSGAAWSAPATPEEAQRLTALFERYVGTPVAGKPPVVSVVPHGEGYTATLDVTRLFGFLSSIGLDLTAGDLVTELTPQPDGLWHVTVKGFPPVGINGNGHATAIALTDYGFDGLFDPRIGTFASGTSTTRGSTTQFRGQDQSVDVKLTGAGQGTTKATDAGHGTVNSTRSSTLTALDYRVTAAAKQDGGDTAAASSDVHVHADTVETSSQIDGEPVAALDELWRFLVAHPNKPALVAAQPELKSRLKALLPFAQAFSSNVAVKRLAVDTHLGSFSLDRLSEASTMGGAAPAGTTASTISYAGLALPSGLLPAWADPLLPTSLELKESYGPVDWANGLTLAIDQFDLAAGNPLTDEQQAAVGRALSPESATLTILPSKLETASLTLSLEGTARMSKPLPTGSGTISVKGLDKTIETVRAAAAGDPTAQQVVTVMLAAKALAQADGPDSYVWKIEAAPDGAVSVNGTPLSSFAPAAPPAIDPNTKPQPKPQPKTKPKKA